MLALRHAGHLSRYEICAVSPRTVAEWSAPPDAPIPPRVRLRVFDRYGGRCQCGCRRKIAAGESWQCDHITALVNGGENVESNLQPVLTAHHRNKTLADVAEKAKVAALRIKHLGLYRSAQPLPCGKQSRYKKTMRGAIVERVSQGAAHRAMMRKRQMGEDQ